MSAPLLDPGLRIVLRGALALLFVWAALHKLRDVAAFRSVLSRYEVLPPSVAPPAAALLIAAELGVAGGLCLPGLGRAAALGAAALLSLYAAAIAVNLRRGRRDLDCGCVGAAGRARLSGGLVGRNGLLAAAALAGTLPAVPRPLVWFDAVTVAGGVAALALLYAAADGLLARAAASRAPARGREAAHA